MQVSALPQGVLPQHRSCVTIREPWVAWVAGNCARLEPSPAYWRGFFNFSSGGENLRATAGPGSAGHRETRVSSGPSAVEGGRGADLPAPGGFPGVCLGGSPGMPKLQLLPVFLGLLQLPLRLSPTTWQPSPSRTPSLLEGTPTRLALLRHRRGFTEGPCRRCRPWMCFGCSRRTGQRGCWSLAPRTRD